MSFEVELWVRCTGHGRVGMKRAEDPTFTREGDGDRDAALKLLDAMVDTVREELGAPSAAPRDDADAAYGWMRGTLHGIAEVLCVPAPFRPSGGERDVAFGADLVERAGESNRAIRKLADALGPRVAPGESAVDVAIRLIGAPGEEVHHVTAEYLAELYENALDHEDTPEGDGPAWSRLGEVERGKAVKAARQVLDRLRGDAVEVEAVGLKALAEELERLSKSATGNAIGAYWDAARIVRGALMDRTVDMAVSGERLVSPKVRALVEELATVLEVPHSPVQPVVTTLSDTVGKARGLDAARREVLAKLRRRNADYNRVVDTAWGLIAGAVGSVGVEWDTAARKWSDRVHGADTVPPDNRWLVDKYVRENYMVLVARDEFERLTARTPGLDILNGGSMTVTTPGDPFGLSDAPDGTVSLDELRAEYPEGLRDLKAKSMDGDLSAALHGKAAGIAAFMRTLREGRMRVAFDPKSAGRTAWADLAAEAARDGRLHVAVDPGSFGEAAPVVFLRIGDGPEMPVILDSEQPHGSFSLRAPRPKGDIVPGGPLDLGDATTVAEISRALARFDHQFHVGSDGEVRTLPQRINELVDHAERMRRLPEERTTSLANALGLSRDEWAELFRDKDDQQRWEALLNLVIRQARDAGQIRTLTALAVHSNPSLAATSAPEVVENLLDENDRLRALPAVRTKELANTLDLSRKQRKQLFRGKDAQGRWNALLSLVSAHLREIALVCDQANTAAEVDPSILPNGLAEPETVADAVARMADRLASLTGRTAGELGDPTAETLADWMEFALAQAEKKADVLVCDAVGHTQWKPLLREAAVHVLLCAAGVRPAARGHKTWLERDRTGSAMVTARCHGCDWTDRDVDGRRIEDACADHEESAGADALPGPHTQSLRDRIIGHATYLAQMAGMTPQRAHELAHDIAGRVLAGPVDEEEIHVALLGLKKPGASDPAEGVISVESVRREALVGDRRVFEADSPEPPGPEVMAVRQIRDLDPADGNGVEDVLYVRSESNGYWAAIREGEKQSSWLWPVVNVAAVADCSDEVDYAAVSHGDGFRVVRRSTGEPLTNEWFTSRDVAEARARELNATARPAILDCAHEVGRKRGRCVTCGTETPEPGA